MNRRLLLNSLKSQCKQASLVLVMLALYLLAAQPAIAAEARGKAKGKAIAGAFKVTDPNVIHRAEVYKRVDDTELKIEIFEPKQKDPAKKYPAVVFFFGGGWTNGNPSQFFPHCEYLVSRGMIAMSADYRVKSRQPGITPVECVKDAKSAMRWVRANAARLGIDPTRLAAGGGSAGGHLAAALATSPGIEEVGEDAKAGCLPDAMLLFNPFIGGGQIESSPQLQGFPRSIMPLYNVKTALPPAIVFLGSNDRVIPVDVAKEFQAKIKECGGKCELRIYEGQTHGFFNYGRGENKVYYYKTLGEADKFLAALGWIAGEPTIPADKLK